MPSFPGRRCVSGPRPLLPPLARRGPREEGELPAVLHGLGAAPFETLVGPLTRSGFGYLKSWFKHIDQDVNVQRAAAHAGRYG